MESQVKLLDEIMKVSDRFEKALPALTTAQSAVRSEVYRDGALPIKVKWLIGLGIAIKAGCVPCILARTRRALEAGATRDEILEVCSVAIAMGGTICTSESLRVIQFLDELGVK
ncbi:MAG: carboxymuconolactone decarboxylase family protein [Dehalococcoidia bacterium]|nr:carboxymuconolactone decarboxylase family protein [Dehalococcoidia bacterium]